MGRWDILNIIDEGVNGETRALLGCLGFHAKNLDDARDLLEYVAWDTSEFKNVRGT